MKPRTVIRNLCKLLSLVFSTFMVLYFIYILIFVKIVLYADTFRTLPVQSTQSDEVGCKGKGASGSISKLQDSRTFVVGAYLDQRSGSVVRIVGITNRYEEEVLYCHFCFQQTNETVVAEFQIHRDHFEFPYGTTDILCNLKGKRRPPEYMSINVGNAPPTVLKIRNTRQEINPALKYEYDFVVCISALFGSYNNVLQFIQSMEMYQMLGAHKVILYHTDSSPLMKKVLSYYTDIEFLEVIPWPITTFLNVSVGWHYPEHPGDLHYYGQTAALNDCVYGYMYRSKFLLLNDIDELIVPAMHKDWPEMMEFLLNSNRTANVFLFENHIFPTTLEDKINPQSPEAWNAVPGFNILHHVYREPNKPNQLNPTKMIINPRSVVSTSVHSPLDFMGEQYTVPSDIARLCHFREPKQKELAKEYLIRDTIMSRYESDLVLRVNNVLNATKFLDTGHKKKNLKEKL